MRRLDGTPRDRVVGVHFVMPIKAARPLHEPAETSHTQYGVDSRDIRQESDTRHPTGNWPGRYGQPTPARQRGHPPEREWEAVPFGRMSP